MTKKRSGVLVPGDIMVNNVGNKPLFPSYRYGVHQTRYMALNESYLVVGRTSYTHGFVWLLVLTKFEMGWIRLTT